MRFTGFLGDLRLTAGDVRAGLSGSEPDTRQIAIVMNEAAAASFALFTTTHVGQRVSLFVCGEQIETLTIQAPIDSGFTLTGPIQFDRAVAMVDALNGLGDCP